jgi:hypothetical protein
VLDDAVPVPRSSGTIALHVGIAALPDVGPAKKQFALCTPKAANICEAVATVAAVVEVAYWIPVGVNKAPPPPLILFHEVPLNCRVKPVMVS